MLNRIIGKEVVEFSTQQLNSLSNKFGHCVVDLGTGDGKFAYEYAKQYPGAFVIGIDADKQQAQELSRKAIRKPAKGGLENVIFLWHSAEELPVELNGIADEIYINFPWASLLSGVILPNDQVMKNIRSLAKPGAPLHIYLTYDRKFEESKIQELGLPELNVDYLNTTLKEKYLPYGIDIQEARILSSEEKRELVGSWPKKILSQRDRDIYYVQAKVSDSEINVTD